MKGDMVSLKNKRSKIMIHETINWVSFAITVIGLPQLIEWYFNKIR